ncbi:MAG: phytoene desaturase family protein, partial [Acidimicrobiia bacterium]
MTDFDATVVGAGPNGLAAALELARAGRRTLLVEGTDSIGGGTRTEELTLPGFKHDVCSAIHPSGIASPFFKEIGLEVEWVHSPISFTHPLEGGRVAALHRSVTETAAGLGEDRSRYESLMTPLVETVDQIVEDVLAPMTMNPKHKAAYARVAAIGALPAAVLAKRFVTQEGKALVAGLSAHSIAPFSAPATAAVGVMLGAIGHSHGWPMARGGSQAIANALADKLRALGGEIETGRSIESIEELPGDLAMLDVMPPAAYRIARSRISASSARRLFRWTPGPGVFKVDWALDGPIPW